MPQRVKELHSIMPINNLGSVKNLGILCHDEAIKLPHADVSMQEIQDKRADKSVPNGLALHQYANLYFCARTPMMFKRKAECHTLCVLRVSIDVFMQPHVVFTDQNAASKYARFFRVQDGIKGLNFDKIFANDWTHPDNQAAFYEHKSMKCAEVLVPKAVEPRFIIGAYVIDEESRHRVSALWPALPVEINANIFFDEVQHG